VNDRALTTTLGVSHWYGPFRPRWMLLLFSLVLAFVAIPIWGTSGAEELSCWRTASGSASCNATVHGSGTTRGFEARTVELSGRLEIVLTDRVGRQLKLWYMGADEAQEPLAELKELLQQGGRKSFWIGHPESVSAKRVAFGLGLLAGLALTWLIWEMSPLWLHFNSTTRVLSVVPTWLCVPLSVKTYNLTGASDVRVTELPRVLSSTRSPESGYRVTCTVGDELINIARGLRPASNSHQRLVDWLRAALGLERASLPQSQSQSQPQPQLQSQPQPQPPLDRSVARRWLNYIRASNVRLTITLVLVVLAILVIAERVAIWHINATQGWLDVTCAHRCRFQGMECFPGGEFQYALDPGRYTVEVWNPQIESLWEPRTIDIVVGQTVRFTCR
jgi:hypothetical protein